MTVVEQLAQLVLTAALRVTRPLHLVLLAADGTEPRLCTAAMGPARPDPPAPQDYMLPADTAGPLIAAWLAAPQRKAVSPLRQAGYAAAEVLGRPDLSAGLRLNRAVSAAEALYRHLESAVPLQPPHDQVDHERVVAAALAGLAPDDRDYLRGRLRDNTRSLRMQFDEIADRVPPEVADYLCPPSLSWSRSAASGRSRAAHGTLDDDQLRQVAPIRRAHALIWAAGL